MRYFTPKFAFIASVILWVLIVLPFFVPQLNVLEPYILGLPFVVFLQYLVLFLQLLLCIFCKKFVWDPFDADSDEEGSK